MTRKAVHMATTHRAGDPRIFQKECRTLARAGYDVTYVVPHPADEVVEGVQIRGVPVPRNGKERMTRTVRDVYRRALAEAAAAVYHLHDADLLPVGFLLKLRGRTVVYDAHEDTPKQMQYQHWLAPRLRPALARAYAVAERLAGRWFDAVVAAEPENAARFPAAKTVLVQNFPLLEELARPDAPPYAERAPLVAYVGSITLVRGLREMVEAVRALPDSYGAELVLGGPFHPASLAADFEAMAAGARVRHLGYLARPAVADLLARARIGIVTLHPTEKYIESYPTKLFEYMSVGLPVIASDFPVWKRIVDEAGCGLTVDPLDPAAIAGAIRWLLDHPAEAEAMGARGRRAVAERYGWEPEGARLLALYDRLSARR